MAAAGRLDGAHDLLADRPGVVGVAPTLGDSVRSVFAEERLAEGVARAPPARSNTALRGSHRTPGRDAAIARALIAVSA